jgi:hypothetical protein
MDEVLWWSVITESYREQVNVIGPFLLEQDAIEWATRWMAEGHGRAGIAGLLAAEEAAEYAGFEWAIAD